jgi:hypothetical protein
MDSESEGGIDLKHVKSAANYLDWI